MNLPRRIAREVVFPAVVKLNLEKLLLLSSNHNKLILAYHGVVDSPNHAISVGPIAVKQFEEHLIYFKKHFDVVSLETIFQMYKDDFTPKKKTLALTFDDGYENNYTRAIPILKKYNFPATMFIISQCIEDENRLTWYDYVDFIKDEINVRDLALNGINKSSLRSISELKALIKTLNIEERNVLYQEIQKQISREDFISKYPREHWKLMNKQQILEIAASSLIEIGAHTHNHPNLGEIKIENAKKEVVECKVLLENLIEKEVPSIAFPDGSYTDEVKQMCLQAGYRNLLAVDQRCASDTGDKNLLLRYCISSTTTFESNMIQVNRHFKDYGF